MFHQKAAGSTLQRNGNGPLPEDQVGLNHRNAIGWDISKCKLWIMYEDDIIVVHRSSEVQFAMMSGHANRGVLVSIGQSKQTDRALWQVWRWHRADEKLGKSRLGKRGGKSWSMGKITSGRLLFQVHGHASPWRMAGEPFRQILVCGSMYMEHQICVMCSTSKCHLVFNWINFMRCLVKINKYMPAPCSPVG